MHTAVGEPAAGGQLQGATERNGLPSAHRQRHGWLGWRPPAASARAPARPATPGQGMEPGGGRGHCWSRRGPVRRMHKVCTQPQGRLPNPSQPTWSWLPGSMRVGCCQAASCCTTSFSGSTGSVPRVCQKSPASGGAARRGHGDAWCAATRSAAVWKSGQQCCMEGLRCRRGQPQQQPI